MGWQETANIIISPGSLEERQQRQNTPRWWVQPSSSWSSCFLALATSDLCLFVGEELDVWVALFQSQSQLVIYAGTTAALFFKSKCSFKSSQS